MSFKATRKWVTDVNWICKLSQLKEWSGMLLPSHACWRWCPQTTIATFHLTDSIASWDTDVLSGIPTHWRTWGTLIIR